MPRQARALAARIGHLASCTEPRTRPRAATAAISWFASNVLSGSAGFMMPIARPHGGCDSDRPPAGAVHETRRRPVGWRGRRSLPAPCGLTLLSTIGAVGCALHSEIAHVARTVKDGKWRAPDSLGYNEHIGAVAAIVAQRLEEALRRRRGQAPAVSARSCSSSRRSGSEVCGCGCPRNQDRRCRRLERPLDACSRP